MKSAGHPLVFLIVSNIMGTMLGLVLIVVFRVSITNMTVTAIVSRLVSYVLMLEYLHASGADCRLRFKGLEVGAICLGRVFRIKVPTKVRDAIVGLSGTLLRSSIGSFKSATVTKCATTGGVFNFLCITIGSIARTYVDFADRGCNIRGFGHVSGILISYLVVSMIASFSLKYNTCFFNSRVLGVCATSPRIVDYKLRVLSCAAMPCFLYKVVSLFPNTLHKVKRSNIPVVLSIVKAMKAEVM